MIKPIKDLGQNFLRNQQVIEKIVKLLEISEKDNILEIGPGEGVLTKEILNKDIDFQLTCIDIDERSVVELKEINDPRIKVILGNILDSEIHSNKIIGAIPYNITSPIFHKIIKLENKPEIVVIVCQKEVAEKISDTKKGSYLSNFIQYFYDVKLEFLIKNTDFYPVPKVDSGVLKLQVKKFENLDISKFSNFLHKTFRSPRKKINKVFDKELLKNLEIDENKRPEDLTKNEILKLYRLENTNPPSLTIPQNR
jgi:16S rRNA (adenine1518-N6/adenine1519-N6)-dimethyltransferase